MKKNSHHLGSPALANQLLPLPKNWKCPGLVHVPRKPHPMGNECHSAVRGLSGTMWKIEEREGKYHPSELGKPLHDEEHGKTGCLLLRVREPMCRSSKVIMLDSVFLRS